MKPFRFTLQAVQTLRQRQEQKARECYARALLAHRQALGQLKQVEIELAQACTTPQAVATEYQAVIDAYGLKFLDLDIEGAAVADPASIARRSQALKLVQNARPNVKISLTLPVLRKSFTLHLPAALAQHQWPAVPSSIASAAVAFLAGSTCRSKSHRASSSSSK